MKQCCKDAMEKEQGDNRPPPAGWLHRLREKWQVKNILQVLLILCTFALGGSLCGYLGRKAMHVIGPDHKALWTVMYILMVTVLWPLCVLLISIPLGQFRFFAKYLAQLGRKISGRRK
ncbi:MAG: hypothetical protein QM642_06980 [Edaphocola sp.]